ncbi:MAG: metallophosphoesterase family protein [Planctomycetota bacterium]
MATYAVGDIHGELVALEEVLAQVEPLLVPGDTLVFLGDYVDRGPDSRGVLERIAGLRAHPPCRVEALLGNHEEWLLRTLRGGTSHSWLLGMDGISTVASYSPEVAAELRGEIARHGVALLRGEARLPYERFFELLPAAHRALLEGLAPFARTPDAVCVHGGAAAGVPAEAQEVRDLVWGAGGFPDDYLGPDLVVYGHRGDGLLDERGRASPRPNEHGRALGIDTIGRGVLTCLRLPDLAVFQSDPARARAQA